MQIEERWKKFHNPEDMVADLQAQISDLKQQLDQARMSTSTIPSCSLVHHWIFLQLVAYRYVQF